MLQTKIQPIYQAILEKKLLLLFFSYGGILYSLHSEALPDYAACGNLRTVDAVFSENKSFEWT